MIVICIFAISTARTGFAVHLSMTMMMTVKIAVLKFLKSTGTFSIKKCFNSRRLLKAINPIKWLFLLTAGLFLSWSAEAIVGGCRLNESSESCLPQLYREQIAKSTVVLLNTSSTHAYSRCTGTLLKNNLILTAAHCLDARKENLSVVFSLYESSVRDRRQVIRFEKLKSFKNFNLPFDHKPNHDLALVQFEGDIPPFYEALDLQEIMRSATTDIALTHSLNNKPMVGIVAGYGISSDHKFDSGELRFSKIFLQPRNLFQSHYIKSQDQIDYGICKGDSGGPLFVVSDHPQSDGNKKIVLIGVTTAIQGGCHGISYFNLIPYYALFLSDLFNTIFSYKP